MRPNLVFSLLALAACPAPVLSSSTITYCSSANTGSGSDATNDTFQSNGACTQTCSDYAFAILQGKNCWCSNIAPNKATNTEDSKCDTGCPGYPDDSCGSAADGVFVYLEMSGNKPSGTATVSSTKSTTSTDSTKTTSSTSSTSSDSSSTTTTSGTSSTTTGSKISIETVAGEIKTVTVANPNNPTSTSSSTSSSNSDDDDGSSLSGGTIAGVVVGAIGGVAAILALIFMIILAKRRSQANSPDPSVQNILLDGRASKGSQMSFMKGMFSDNHSHTLSAGSSISPGRMVPPTFTDNRMKTDTVLWPAGRRDSSVSLQDNEDYSRPVLRLTNPD